MKALPYALATIAALGWSQAHGQATAKVSLLERPAPSIENLPDDEYGRLARYGHELSKRTFAYIGPEAKDAKMRYAGNNLSCTACHQEDATKPFAMPWVGVSATFPQYRGREDDISTVEDRVNGCMQRSMNGKPIPLDSREMKAFVTYINFLSQGISVGAKIEGGATKGSKPPNRRADLAAGKKVYAEKCTVCHGENGEGKRNGVVGDAQGYAFPPVWGPDSFNTGAGMNRILMAMRFIKHNMPLGARHNATLISDEEAFDVAGYIMSKPRPEKANLDQDFPARWNKPIDAAFPPYVQGGTPDQHKFGPFPPLAEVARQMAAKRAADLASSQKTTAAK
jgi:thiosulfate dehydrogenase